MEKISIEDRTPHHEQICKAFNAKGESMIVKWWCEFGFGSWAYTTCNRKVGIYSPIGLGKVTHWLPEPPPTASNSN